MLKVELPGKRKEGRLKRKFMDVFREDMQVAGTRQEDAKRWKQMICCSSP